MKTIVSLCAMAIVLTWTTGCAMLPFGGGFASYEQDPFMDLTSADKPVYNWGPAGYASLDTAAPAPSIAYEYSAARAAAAREYAAQQPPIPTLQTPLAHPMESINPVAAIDPQPFAETQAAPATAHVIAEVAQSAIANARLTNRNMLQTVDHIRSNPFAEFDEDVHPDPFDESYADAANDDVAVRAVEFSEGETSGQYESDPIAPAVYEIPLTRPEADTVLHANYTAPDADPFSDSKQPQFQPVAAQTINPPAALSRLTPPSLESSASPPPGRNREGLTFDDGWRAVDEP